MRPVSKLNETVNSKRGYLIILGAGADLFIADKCNENFNSGSYLGETFQLPRGIQVGSTQAKEYLAGTYNFQVKDIEVY
jgi:hypothetical protein